MRRPAAPSVTAPPPALERPLVPVTGSGGVDRIVLLGALTALPALAIDAYLPALPSLARDLATTTAATQLTLTAVLVGLALGQLLTGPVSDRLGRRTPLLAGLGLFVASSLLCALAPSVEVLVALRLVQGLSGGAAIVVSRAVVRDQVDGAAAARAFARLILVMGVAPVVAPVAGAQLLRVSSWRGVFVGLAVVGAVLLLATARRLTETLPVERRSDAGVRPILVVFGQLLRDRGFVGYALSGALSFAGLFAYISASPFVLQEVHGLSPAAFSAVFAANAAGFIAMSQLSGALVTRTGPRPLLLTGLALGLTAGVGLLAAVLTGAPLPLVLAALFLLLSSVGFVAPNATALALADHGRHAGTASALLGLLQFVLGAAAAPLTGLGGSGTAVPLAVVVATVTALAAASALLTRPRAAVPV